MNDAVSEKLTPPDSELFLEQLGRRVSARLSVSLQAQLCQSCCVMWASSHLSEPQFPDTACGNNNALLLRLSRGFGEGLTPCRAHKRVHSAVAIIIVVNKDDL